MTGSRAARETWIREARELLPDLESALIMLEASIDDGGEGYLKRARELLRTLRAGAGRPGGDSSDDIYDGIERVLDTLAARRSPMGAEIADALLESVDTLKGMVAERSESTAIPDPAAALASIERVLKALLS